MELYKIKFCIEKNVLILSYLHKFKMAAHEYFVVALWFGYVLLLVENGLVLSTGPYADNCGLAHIPSIYVCV